MAYLRRPMKCSQKRTTHTYHTASKHWARRQTILQVLTQPLHTWLLVISFTWRIQWFNHTLVCTNVLCWYLLIQRCSLLSPSWHTDKIMDMLGSEESRNAILNYYQHTHEPQAVKIAIEECKINMCDVNTGAIKQRWGHTQSSAVAVVRGVVNTWQFFQPDVNGAIYNHCWLRFYSIPLKNVLR